MEQVNLAKQQIEKFCKEKNSFTQVLGMIELKTNVSKPNQIYGALIFLTIYLMVGYGSHFLCNFVGFLYPAYASLKAIESKEKDDDTKWLTYWVVYSAFSIVEVFADIFLFWIPLYSLLKCAFLLYLMAPIANNGSILLYNKIIRPNVLKYQSHIDKTIDNAAELVGEMSDKARRKATEYASDKLM